MSTQRSDLSGALDHAFREVIETMFGLSVEGPVSSVDAGGMALAGIVGLAGPDFRGILHVACTDAAANRLAGALLGGEEPDAGGPGMVADSIGELTNMIAGSVKRRLDDSGSRIELSLPSVLQGEATLHGIGATGGAHMTWTVEGHRVRTSLVYIQDLATAGVDLRSVGGRA